jgi:hypothetical protein
MPIWLLAKLHNFFIFTYDRTTCVVMRIASTELQQLVLMLSCSSVNISSCACVLYWFIGQHCGERDF